MSQPCSICSLPDRKKVDEALLAGEAYTVLATRFDVGRRSVARHFKAHVAPRIARAHKNRAERIRWAEGIRSAEAQENRHAEGLLDRDSLRRRAARSV